MWSSVWGTLLAVWHLAPGWLRQVYSDLEEEPQKVVVGGGALDTWVCTGACCLEQMHYTKTSARFPRSKHQRVKSERNSLYIYHTGSLRSSLRWNLSPDLGGLSVISTVLYTQISWKGFPCLKLLGILGLQSYEKCLLDHYLDNLSDYLSKTKPGNDSFDFCQSWSVATLGSGRTGFPWQVSLAAWWMEVYVWC